MKFVINTQPLGKTEQVVRGKKPLAFINEPIKYDNVALFCKFK